MLMRIWTNTLLVLVGLLTVVWLALVCREKDFRPLKHLRGFFAKQTKVGKIVFGTFFFVMWLYASVKPENGNGDGGGSGGDGGTNGIQMVVQPETGTLGHIAPLDGGSVLDGVGSGVAGSPAALQPHLVQDGVGDGVSGFEAITSTNTTRTLTAEDFERGFVMTRIGTDEDFDFSASTNATVCSDWRAFGAAEDWIYLAFTDWEMSLGTNAVDTLRVFSFGKVVPFIQGDNGEIAPNSWFAPFLARLGIVPEANWAYLSETNLPSQFWYAVTERETLLLTWQNVLLDRDTEKTVSFQVELHPGGRFEYRYDFSRLPSDALTNFVSGASFAGCAWTTNSLPTNATSMAFHALSPEDCYNQDPDSDGLATIDELFVYNTDPRNPDTDYDGLSDGDEVNVHGTDPLDPNSLRADVPDGMAAVMGDLDPFEIPEGSTNTVWEHVFYTGTTNAPFAYPVDTDETAVLVVTVTGSGTGRIVVGDTVVPVIARPAPPLRGMSGGDDPTANTVRVAKPKGVRYKFWGDVPETLQVEVDSGSLAIGSLPPWYVPKRGWIAFPHTDATVPCIHDLRARRKEVSLLHGEEFPGLTATWTTDAADVAVTNRAPVSAELHGGFSTRSARAVSYTVDHPDGLFNCPATFTQELRFCPPLSEAEETVIGFGSLPEDEDSGFGSALVSIPGEQEPSEDEAEAEFEAAVSLPAWEQGVLYLHGSGSPTQDVVSLDVPSGAPRRCCPCPDHSTNHVALAYASRSIGVTGPDGAPFESSTVDCAVRVSPRSPSREIGDARALFVTNGAWHAANAYTVLGLAVERPYGVPLARYNDLSPSLGFPFVVHTNIDAEARLDLRSDVLFTNGVYRLALTNATGRITVWENGYWEWLDAENGWVERPPTLLLDSETQPVRHFTARQWLRIVRRHSSDRRMPVYLTSDAAGRCDLDFSYALASGGTRKIHAHARQRVTSVNPPLLPDYNRDGRIDATDVAFYLAGRVVHFWKNDDKYKGDNAFDAPLINHVNSASDVIDGRNDLINFLPMAVDIKDMATHWGQDRVRYILEVYSRDLGRAKMTFANVPWGSVGDISCDAGTSLAGNPLRNAPVSKIGPSTNLPTNFVSLAAADSSTILMEFPETCRGDLLYLHAYDNTDDSLLFSAPLEIYVGDVGQMIGWMNLRSVTGGSGGVATRLATPDWPAGEHEEGNVVFVHGYNMEEDDETPAWAKNVFKKLWWSGLDSGFVAVQWRGNEGQSWFEVPTQGYVTPNYYGNVQNAFATAAALSNAMESVHGPKWFLAHSLGNMLVSAAIQDYGMEHERYFMLNAAVPMEAFEPTGGITTESHDNMTPTDWIDYADRLRATHWFERFPEGDRRRLLTWKGRFANVTNIVNFYSTEEEVVNNGDGGTHSTFERNYVWYNQEVAKGKWTWMLHDAEGGWEFNNFYDVQWHTMPPESAANLTDEQLRQHPFFQDFSNPEMYASSNGLIVATNYLYRAEMLAYAIPSESYAVGANPLHFLDEITKEERDNGLSGNYNMAVLFDDGRADLPENGTEPEDRHKDWQHSTFVQRSYKRTRQLFRTIIKVTKRNH